MKKIIIPALFVCATVGSFMSYSSLKMNSSASALTLANMIALAEDVEEDTAGLVKDVETQVQDPITGEITTSSYRICVGFGNIKC